MRLGLFLGVGMQRGASGPSTGPTIATPGSLDVSTFKIGTEHTITAGTATATGGGTVTYEFRWLVNGTSDATTAAYTPLAADDEQPIAAQWRAVETGGTNAGETAWQTVGSGTITYPAAVNSVAPVVSGDTSLGDVLTTTNGTWTGATGGAYTYQWQRAGVDISGETATTYTIVAADDAAAVRCVVTYTNSGGAVSANSNAVTVDDFAVPVITGVPTIAGTETVGETLTATAASVTGTPSPTRTWQWERSGTAISGATSATYVLQAADEGETITAVQTETNALGSDTAESTATGAIAASGATNPTVAITEFTDSTDTGTFTSDLAGNAYIAWYSNVDGVPTLGGSGFSGGGLTEQDDMGAVSAGSNSLTATYTRTSGPADRLIIGVVTGAGGLGTSDAQAFTPNLSPEQMSAPSLVVDSDTQITATLAAAPEGYQNGVDSYDLRHSTDEATWTTLTGITSPRAITGLDAETLYYVQSRAVNEDGAGAWSTSATATTDAAAAATVPAQMSAPTLSVVSDTEISVDRAAAPDDGGSAITSYDLRHSTDEATWTTVTGITDPQTISSLNAETLYYVQTRAVNAIGAGAWSTSATATTQAAVTWTTILADSFTTSDDADYTPTGTDIPTAAPDKWTESYADAGVAALIDPLGTAEMKATSGMSQNLRITYADTVTDDQAVEATLGTFTPSNDNRPVLLVRHSGATTNGTGVRAMWKPITNELQLTEFSANAVVSGQDVTVVSTIATGDVIRLEVIGTTAYAKVGGTTIATLTGLTVASGAPGWGTFAGNTVGEVNLTGVTVEDTSSAGYTLQTVDNQGTASYSLSGSFASDSTNFWFSGWFNFTSDVVSIAQMFETAGRTEVRRESDTVNFRVTSTGATSLLDINTPQILAGNLTHILLIYDGTATTGGFTLYINGVDETANVVTDTAWNAGTVDHTRGSASVFGGIDTIVGDLMIGAGTPPAIGDVYPAQDISGVTATVKISGDASVWNTGPAGWTVTGTFVDA